jgi:adenine-specific DNA methylase
LVFTFHHKDPKSWAAVLQSLLDANFYVVVVYPVFSEARGGSGGGGIVGRESRAFDTIIVAKKKLVESKEEKLWEKLKDEIYVRAKESLERVRRSHPNLSNGDISTIVLGKCLEVYSQYYPNVIDVKGRKIDAQQAVKDISGLIDSLKIEEYIPPNIDDITSVYIQFLAAKRTIDFNELNKILQPKGLSEDKFKEAIILEPSGSIYKILTPKERGAILEERMKSKKFEFKYYIDIIHHIYYVYEQYGKLPKSLGNFDVKVIRDVLNYLYKKTKDKTYKTLKELLEGYKPSKVITLERFI